MQPVRKQRKQRFELSNAHRASLRIQHRSKPNYTLPELRNWFKSIYNQDVNESTISRALSSKYSFLDDNMTHHRLDVKRRRLENWPDLEKAILSWIVKAERVIIISQEIVREKAKQYWPRIYPHNPIPSFSNGWLQGFQNRKRIRCRTLHGEAGSIDLYASDEMIQIRETISQYEAKDIFNCDETSLYWKMIPDRSLTTTVVPGRKKQKARISALFYCNQTGKEKLPIWFIRRAKKPRCFGRIIPANLGFVWRNNTKAWMTGVIFQDWLRWFDHLMNGRTVLLLMDNFSAHEAGIKGLEFDDIQLQNTTIIFLPANSTARYQPLDQGIIRTWKAYWRRQWLQYMLYEYDNNRDPIATIDVLKSIRWGLNAWAEKVTEETISNCFKKALSEPGTSSIELPEDAINDIQQGLQQLKTSKRINEVMDLQNFLNPLGEEVVDDPKDLDEIILSQFEPTNIEEDSDEDEGEVPPVISTIEATELVSRLRLYEEQQENANKVLIKDLLRHEKVIQRRKVDSQQQLNIRHFFTSK